MSTKSRKFTSSKPEQLRLAREAALRYYVVNRNENGSLRTQEEIAKEMGLKAPRFSDLLNMAWQSGMIEVAVSPVGESGVAADFEEVLRRESVLLRKLREISPPLLDTDGKVLRPHKLRRVHVVSNSLGKTFDSAEIDIQQSSDFGSVATRIRRRASGELLKLVSSNYRDDAELHVGIGWGRSCEGVVNFLKSPPKTFGKLICCPLVGMIGYTQNSFDASFLAFRLASRLSASSIKLSCPIIQERGSDLENLYPIKEALGHLSKCEIGISAVGIADMAHSVLMRRKIFNEEQIRLIRHHGAVAEVNSHFFNIEAEPIDPELLGFKPVGIGVDEMKRMPRYILVVSPDRRKIIPALVAIKAGVCSDLVVDHLMAQEILEMELDDQLV